MENIEIRTVQITRYITPLREGGSLPAIVEGDDDFLYVAKFRGAGQGAKALIAELLGGELARCLGLKIPEIVFAELSPVFGKTEPDEEIQDLLQASTGLNLALHYLSKAITFDPVVNKIDPTLASQVVWFDWLINNVDRTVKNTNMLIWNSELWLIDHGASLFFHHHWDQWQSKINNKFTALKDHVLLPYAIDLLQVNHDFTQKITPVIIKSIIQKIPEKWLEMDMAYSPDEQRNIYFEFLTGRLLHSEKVVEEAEYARTQGI